MSDNRDWSINYDSNSFGFFTFYGNYMYFPNRESGTIVQTNLDGTVNNGSFASNLAPYACYAYNGYLYVSNGVYGGPGDGVITQISLTDNTQIRNWAQIGGISPNAIVAYGSYLYVSCWTDNRIYKIEINNPSNTTIFIRGPSSLLGLAVDGEYLYIASGAVSGVLRTSLNHSSNTDYEVFYFTPGFRSNSTYGLAISGRYLYVSCADQNIYKVLISDPTSSSIFKSNGDINRYSLGLTYYNNYLYASSSRSILYPFNGGSNGRGTIAKYYIEPPPVPPPPCFKEGTKILTMKGYKLVQDLRKGDMVKTLKNDYKAIEMIGKKEFIHNPTPENRVKEQLYVCSKPEFDQIIEPLVLTGCHCILVDKFVSEEQKQKTIEVNGKICITDNKYRLPACAHHGTTVYEIPGTYTIYHLALENEDYFMNYGIYANGLLVESCSRRYLKELSNMELIE
jgi:hypothetical protein